MSHYGSPKNVKHYNPQVQLQDVHSDSLHSLSENIITYQLSTYTLQSLCCQIVGCRKKLIICLIASEKNSCKISEK